MVSASNARARFPRPASRSCRIHLTVSSAPKKSSAGRTAANDSASRHANPSAAPDALPRNRYFIYFGLAIVGCAADLFTKQAVFRWRGLPRPGNVWWLVEGRFGIETSVNPGALFGM